MNSGRGLLLAHFSVLLFALSGVIAKVVDQSATVLTCARSLLAAVVLGAVLYFSQGLPRVSGKNRWVLLLSGLLLALHWIAFYHSIKVSSVSIGVVAVSTFPVMTAVLEPLIMRRPWSYSLLIAPCFILIGTAILLGFSPEPDDVHGLLWGFTAALLFVFVHLINKLQVIDLDGKSLSFIQLSIAGLVLLPLGIIGYDAGTAHHTRDIFLIIFLAVFSTALAYALFIQSMKTLSASTAAILTGLEPVYAMIIAILFLDEDFELRIVLGALIILITVVWSSFRSVRSLAAVQKKLKERIDV
ncbi:MAG: EamA family transporter [Flavobacteriales bacterium]|nr:EamA family transporter [Flavobacteriales bacterium]